MRAGALDLAIGRRRQAARLRPFLQHRLGIAQRPHRRAHPLAPKPFDQLGRGRHSRRRERPRRSAPRRRRPGSRCARRPPALASEAPSRSAVAEIDGARDIGAGSRGAPDRRAGATVRPRRPSGNARNSMSEMIKPEHVIAEKFQPLIAAGPAAAGQRRNMRQRTVEQLAVLEAIADGLFQRARGYARACVRRAAARAAAGRSWLQAALRGAFVRLRRRFGALCSWLRPAPHRTIVNSRLQRTDHGQRQISHARSPSCTEKKMSCARPTMFSNGTIADLREAAVGRVVAVVAHHEIIAGRHVIDLGVVRTAGCRADRAWCSSRRSAASPSSAAPAWRGRPRPRR